MSARLGSRLLPALASALLTVTLLPGSPAHASNQPSSAQPASSLGAAIEAAASTSDTTAAATAAPSRPAAKTKADYGRATDITDGLPVTSIDSARTDADDDAVESVLLPDTGVAPKVTREAADGDDVAVIVRLREQVDMTALATDADAAALDAALTRRTQLNSRDLSQATENRRVADAGQDAKSTLVVDALRSFAGDERSSVASLFQQLRTDGHATKVQPYWIFNGFSATVDSEALNRLTRHPDVASVTVDGMIQEPTPEPLEGGPKLPTWGLERVHAPQVWSEFDDRGQGTVVGIMDSGVDGSHPALAGSWRGNTGDLEKSWFVATSEDYPAPGDGFGHGTHVAGSIVGGAPGEVVGVAPKATWIAAKIFSDGGGASTSGIHRGFEWMLAPGGDPTAAPDLVSNSWGSADTYNTQYWGDVEAWRAAGIVPIFANGNDGPGPTTVGSPGSFPNSFAVGATDFNDVVAGFSSRGPVSWEGVDYTKPEIAAPGHHIYSSFPTSLGEGEYVELSGTSMATPHVSGVAALLLAANPNLTVDDVETMLTSTARQESHMGSSLPDNDYGNGIVDAYAAVTKAINSGTVSGTVTSKAGPVAGAKLVVSGTRWNTTSNDAGQFQLTVPAGNQTIRVTAPGFQTANVPVKITPGSALTRTIDLKSAKNHAVSGTVRSAPGPAGQVAGAEVSFDGSGVDPVFTGSNGKFSTSIPAGEYVVRVRATGFKPWSSTVSIPKTKMLNPTLAPLASATDNGWTQYQNNSAHSGYTSKAVAPDTLRREWSVDTGTGITFASPVIADGIVYVGTISGELQARNLDTGELMWRYDVGDQLRGSPAVSDGVVVIGGGLAGGFTALDAATGDVLWHVATPGQLAVYTQPAVVDGVVYANTGPSEVADSVYAIDLMTGEVLWSTPVAAGIFNGPAVDGGQLYVTSADEGRLVALDTSTGEVAWTLQRDDDTFYSAPTVSDGLVYVTTTSDAAWDGTFLAVNADDGTIAWQNSTHGDAQGSSPAIYGDLVISGTHANGAVVAYDRITGTVAWRHQDTGPVSSSLMTTGDGYVIGGSQIDSVLFALDAVTGKRVWVDDVDANVTSSGAYDDGTFVTGDTSGMLYAYRTTGGVTGTVTGPDGPLDATVTITDTGALTTTDPATGDYQLDHRPGSYQLQASAYGFSDESQQVTIAAGQITSADFALTPVGTGSVTGTVLDGDGNPIEGAEVVLEGTPLDPATTAANGTFSFATIAAGSYQLRVDKDAFVPYTTEVSVTAGQTTDQPVTLDRYQVAVMGDYQGRMVGVLEDLGYPADTTSYAEVTAHPDYYDVVLANGAEDRPAAGVIQPFIDATDAAGTSVIWLDQWSIGYGSILNLSDQTGDPASVVTDSTGSGRVSLIAGQEHPLTEGLTVGSRVPVLAANNEWAAFNGYSGVNLASLHTDGKGEVGSGIAYKPRSTDSVHVLLSSFAAAPWGRPDVEWLPITEQLIGNAVDYAIDADYGVVHGTVTGEGGAPAAATVTAVGTGYHTSTASDGSYKLVLDPGTYTLRFRATGAAAVERDVTVTGGETQTVDVTMTPAELGSVTGTVSDGDGEPVAGATVTIDGTTFNATTASDGTYTVSGLPAEDYTLSVAATGFLPYSQDVTIVGGQTITADVTLDTAPHVGIMGDYQNTIATVLQVRGLTTEQLTWTSTARIPDLDVVVFNDPTTPTVAQFASWQSAMDANGVSGVFGDGYFSSDGGVRLLRQFNGNPSQPRAQFDDEGEVSFSAADASHPIFDGLPANPPVLTANNYSTAIPGYTGFPVADVVSELGGSHGVGITYQPRTPSSIHLLLGGMTSDILLKASEDWTAQGRRLYANSVLFAADPALGSVSGTVSDEAGAPVSGTVSVDGTEQRTPTAADGSYTLSLPPGDYTIRYAGFGYDETTREVSIDDGGAVTSDVALTPKADDGSLSGVVTSDGQPVAGVTVRLLGAPRLATTASDGSYVLPRVEPSNYQVDVTHDGYLRDRDAVNVTAGAPTSYDVNLRVTARVGVIDDYQGKVAAWLTHWGYTPQALSWSDTAAIADLDLVIANNANNAGFDPGRAGLQAFDSAALRAGISVVWLDQFGRGSFRYLTDYTGDPTGNNEDRSDGAVTVQVEDSDHPIMAGLPSTFKLIDDGSEYSWFDGFSGDTLATVSSDVLDGGGLVGERPRGAAGVDVLLGTLSMSTYGFAGYDDVVGDAWSPQAELLLRNAVRYALDAPPAGGQVEGALTSAAGPVAGTVTVVETGRRYDVAADGDYVVGLPAGTWTLRGEATNHASSEVSVTVGVGESVSRDIALALLPAGDVSGTVTDESAAPVSGATVRVDGTAFAATTSADGSFLIEGVPAGDYRVSASATGLQTGRVPVTIVAGEAATADLELDPSVPVALVGDYLGSVRGLLATDGYTVTDYTPTELSTLREQIDEYDVVVFNRGVSSAFLGEFNATLNAAADNGVSVLFGGQWGGDAIGSLHDLRGDPASVDYDFVPSPVSYVPVSGHPIFAGFDAGEPVTIINDPEGGNQQYLTFGGYSGTTIADLHNDADGSKLGGGVGVAYTSTDSVEVLLGSLTAGTYGRPGDEWTAAAERIYLNAVSFAATATRGEINGTVTSGGDPVVGADVRITELGASDVTDEAGGYAIGVPDGTYTVTVEATGYQPSSQQVTVTDSEQVTADIALEPLARGVLSGTVVDDGGQPVEGATVIGSGVEGFRTMTDAGGHYSQSGLLDGEYTIAVAAEGYLTDESTIDYVGPETTHNVELTSIDVGVVGDVDGQVVDFLREHDVAAGKVPWSTKMDLSAYDAVVVNGSGGGTVSQAEFNSLEAATRASHTGVVWTGTWGSEGGIRLLEKFTDRVKVGSDGYGDGSVRLTEQDRRHALFAGISNPATILTEGSYYSTIESYKGPRLATQRVTLNNGGSSVGNGATFRWVTHNDVEVLLASMAVTGAVGPDMGWTTSGERLFLNAVGFAQSPR